MPSALKVPAFVGALSVAVLGEGGAGPAGAGDDSTTVVLVHGAFADGSSWNRVIPKLQAEGLNVVSVQNPLTSLADDVAVTRRVLDIQTGSVVLVGHSWGDTRAAWHPFRDDLIPDPEPSGTNLLSSSGREGSVTSSTPWGAERLAGGDVPGQRASRTSFQNHAQIRQALTLHGN